MGATTMNDASIHVYLRVGISQDKKEGFEQIMHELVDVAEREPGTLMYEWFICDEGKTCHIHERYANEREGDKHVRNFAENYAARFFDHITAIEGVVSANASPYIRAVLDGIKPTYAAKAAGFNRF
jgi:quinol monooxygenase YgiN